MFFELRCQYSAVMSLNWHWEMLDFMPWTSLNFELTDIKSETGWSSLSSLISKLQLDGVVHQIHLISSNRKLVFYSTFKHDTKCSSFLELITNEDHRKATAKFWLGNHNLKIETGRHSCPKIPENLRTCNHSDVNYIKPNSKYIYNDIESKYQNFKRMNGQGAVLI